MIARISEAILPRADVHDDREPHQRDACRARATFASISGGHEITKRDRRILRRLRSGTSVEEAFAELGEDAA